MSAHLTAEHRARGDRNNAPQPLTAAAVRAAAARINSHIVRTPIALSEGLSQATGASVYLKYENMQHTGAFKARGAIAKLTLLTPTQMSCGVIAMSAGNHAQGVAFHGTRLGVPVTIVMPVNTPFLKVRKTRDYGATVILEGEDFQEASAACTRIAHERGLTIIHPYDDEDVIAGQGTIGLEIIEDVPDIDILVVPVGGGGLIAGVALAVGSINPQVDVIGVQTALYPGMINALTGRQNVCAGATLAEGIAVQTVGVRATSIVRTCVKDVIEVSEGAIERAIGMAATIGKTVVEGAGAAPLAAMLENPARFRGKKVGLLMSGGNIDPRLLSSVLMRDLVRAGQVVTLDIEMPDKPGQLHLVSGICAAVGANILEVVHGRFGMDLTAKSARLSVTVETRDEDHADQLTRDIRSAGFKMAAREYNGRECSEKVSSAVAVSAGSAATPQEAR